MRLFYAIKLDDKLSDKIVKMQENIKKGGFLGKCVDKANFHITLAFIGEVEGKKCEILEEVLNSIAVTPFSVHLNRIKRLKDMIVIEVEKDEKIMHLEKELTNKLKEANFTLQERTFYPHITIIRGCNKDIDKAIDISQEVKEITLFETIRKDGKIRYQPKMIKEVTQ